MKDIKAIETGLLYLQIEKLNYLYCNSCLVEVRLLPGVIKFGIQFI